MAIAMITNEASMICRGKRRMRKIQSMENASAIAQAMAMMITRSRVSTTVVLLLLLPLAGLDRRDLNSFASNPPWLKNSLP